LLKGAKSFNIEPKTGNESIGKF